MKNNLMAIKRYANKHGWNGTAIKMLGENISKKGFRKHYGKQFKSIMEEPRCMADKDDYESFCEYWIESLPDWTEEDIKEYIEDMWISINSPYDCTGLQFTVSIHYHINPCGLVSFIHYKGIDV